MLYAFAYTRFSSENQTGNSTDTQYRSIRDYADKNGYSIIEHLDDAAVSGRTPGREEFMRMVGMIKAGKVKADAILVYKFSRFMRNMEESVIYRRMLERLGVKVISVTEKVPDEGPVGKLIENVLACIDQFYSDLLAGLSLEGQKEIVRNKYWPGGPPPFGYDLKKIANAEGHSRKGQIVQRNVLVVNAAEAKIVKRIFEISAETGKGGHLIYKQLCDEFGGAILGRPKPKRSPNGERFLLPAQPMDGGSINAILKKKIYVGVFIYNSHGLRAAVEGANERQAKKERYAKPKEEWIEVRDESWRIVSDELWAAAEASRTANQSVRKDFGFSNRKAAYALTGLIECGKCGQNFGGKWQRSRNLGFSDKSEYFYYRCRQAMNGAAGCDNKSKIDGAQLEYALIDTILKQLFDKKFLLDLAKEILDFSRSTEASQDDRAELEQRRKDISASIDRMIELFKNMQAEVPEVAAQISALESERAAIDAKLRVQALAGATLTVEELLPQIEKKLEHPRQLFLTCADVHALHWELGRWVETVRVDADGKIAVKWKSKAVFELLDLPPVSVSDVSGTPYGANGHRLAALYAWLPIASSAQVCAPWMAASGVSGFSGFLGNPSTVNDSQIVGFSGMAARAPAESGCFGFSGFSGHRSA